MREIEYSYHGVPTIREFSEDDSFIRGLMGCFGSGKSSGCVIEIMKRALQQEKGKDGVARSRWAVVRNTVPQLRDTTIKTFFQWVKPGVHGTFNKTENNFLINKFPGYEIEIMFRALDRPDQVDNLLSLELTGAWINEARELPYAVVSHIQSRLGRYPRKEDGGATWKGLIMDTNPPDSDSWWYKLFEEDKPSNARIFKQPSGLSRDAENVENLPDDYYTNLAIGKSDDYKQVYIHGEYGFVQDGRPVFPEYSDNTHCKEFDLIAGGAVYMGVDFGLTPAIVLAQVAPSGQLRIFDELFEDEISGIDRFSDKLLQKMQLEYPELPIKMMACDPAGDQRSQTDEGTCIQILRNKFETNFNRGVVVKGDQSPEIRQESVRKGLTSLLDGEPALIIHPRCKVLRKGFQGKYRFKRIQTNDGIYKDAPDKNIQSHIADGCQYLCTKIFGQALLASRQDWSPITYPAMGIV